MTTIPKICVVTGTRAEYGLLRYLIEGISNSSKLKLQLVVTGMHLSPEFGMTIKDIQLDGFNIDRMVEILLSSDTPVGITKSMGLGMIGFADAFADLRPDLLLILGDRFEIFTAASAALIARIPVAHIHGGEVTEGLIDESIRHSITKMSHLHFVALEDYRRRVIQLGEDPSRVFCVGGMGVDSLKRTPLLNKSELQRSLDFKFLPRNLLITFHPCTLESGTSTYQIAQLLEALNQLKDTGLIFTLPNADTEGREIYHQILSFCEQSIHAKAYKSLGQKRYLSCLRFVDAVVGNSSSGLLEVPSFRKATINIGDRQKGRVRSSSIIDCLPDSNSILEAIALSYSTDFCDRLKSCTNPYGLGGASEAILEQLENVSFDHLLKKPFCDLFIP